MTTVQAGVLLIALAVSSAACGAEVVPPSVDPAIRSGIGVDNGTTLPITIFVNGTRIETIPPHSRQDIVGGGLPALPWQIEAQTPTGRVLLTLQVEPGTVTRTDNIDGSSSSRSAGNRVDLSCGRLDVYVGMPMSGPVPGPGEPGDCEP